MQTLLAIMLVIVAAAPRPSPLVPRPSPEDLARAEATVQDVFGDELAEARRPADQTALARRILATAEGSTPAERYALFVQARELAITAGDSALGMEAVEGLAGFGGEGSATRDAAAWASEGHRLWNQATKKQPPERLRGRLAAAERYLRALPGLAGVDKTAVANRLRELRRVQEPEVLAADKHEGVAGPPGRNRDFAFRFQTEKPVRLAGTCLRFRTFNTRDHDSNGTIRLSLDGRTWVAVGTWDKASCTEAIRKRRGWMLLTLDLPEKIEAPGFVLKFEWASGGHALAVYGVEWLDRRPASFPQ